MKTQMLIPVCIKCEAGSARRDDEEIGMLANCIFMNVYINKS